MGQDGPSSHLNFLLIVIFSYLVLHCLMWSKQFPVYCISDRDMCLGTCVWIKSSVTVFIEPYVLLEGHMAHVRETGSS